MTNLDPIGGGMWTCIGKPNLKLWGLGTEDDMGSIMGELMLRGFGSGRVGIPL